MNVMMAGAFKKHKGLWRRRIALAAFIFFAASRPSGWAQDESADLICNIYYERGVRFYKQAEYERATEEFQRIIELCPQHEKAQQYLSAAKKKQAKQTVFNLYDEAKRAQAQRDYRGALQAYRKVLDIVPRDGYALHHIALLEYKVDKSEKRQSRERLRGIESLKKEVMENKKSRYLDSLKAGIRFYKKSKYAEAIRELEKVLAEKPDHPRARFYLQASQEKKDALRLKQLKVQAAAYESLRKYQSAAGAYQEILSIMGRGSYSLFEFEKAKAKIEKMQWLQENVSLQKKKKAGAAPQRSSRQKEPLKKEAVAQSRPQPDLSDTPQAAREIEEALEAAEATKQKKEKMLVEGMGQALSSSGSGEVDGISQESGAGGSQDEIRVVYERALEYYKEEKFRDALEYFQRVIDLEKDVAEKHYTAKAQRYVEYAQQEYDDQIEKEFSLQQAR